MEPFGAGGISNPLEVMEQMTLFAIFIRRLDEIQITKEKANRLKTAVEKPILHLSKTIFVGQSLLLW